LHRQEHDCRELCQRLGLNVAGVYADAGKSRKERVRMLDDAGKSMFDTVVVEDVDRLGRADVAHVFAALEDAAIHVISCGQGLLTRKNLFISAIAVGQEARKRAYRMRQGKLMRLRVVRGS